MCSSYFVVLSATSSSTMPIAQLKSLRNSQKEPRYCTIVIPSLNYMYTSPVPPPPSSPPLPLQTDMLVSYQIGFDLYESAPQHFLHEVQCALKSILPNPPPPAQPLEKTSMEEKNKETAMDDDDGTATKEKVGEEPLNDKVEPESTKE